MTQSNSKTFAFYCRSSIKSKQFIEKQHEQLAMYAKDNDIEKYKFYVDNGYAGNTLERPALKQMLKDIQAGKIGSLFQRRQSSEGFL